MKFRPLISLSLGLMLLASCSSEEPTIPSPEVQPDVISPEGSEPEPLESLTISSEFPTLDEVMKCVDGKTFSCEIDEYGHTQQTYVDSKGREITVDEFWKFCGLCGYVFGLPGLSFDADKIRLATSIIYTPGFSNTGTWTYDEATGRLEVKRDKYTYLYIIESVADTHIVVRSEFDILIEGTYERAHGLEYPDSYRWDEGSYAKATYVAVTKEDAKAFWDRYPEQE